MRVHAIKVDISVMGSMITITITASMLIVKKFKWGCV